MAVILSFLMAENVFARELSNKALAKISPSALEHFLDSGERELIFLLDDSGIAQSAHQDRIKGRSVFDTQSNLRSKNRAYLDIKNAVMVDFEQHEFQALYTYESLPMMFARVSTPETLYRLLENDHILQVFENTVHSLTLTESLPLIGQPESYAAGHGGQGTTVAVLDTGVDYRRAAFGSCTAPGIPNDCKVIFAEDFTEFNDGELDAHGHGTNVTGIVVGVAPDTKIAALDIFTGNGINTADAIAAIDWVIANQAVYNIVAMNLSLGIGVFDQVCDFSWATTPFAKARAVGVVPIVASGNDSQIAKVKNPACAPGAISVGAVYDTKAAGSGFRACGSNRIDKDVVPCFSNSASFLDFLAPGIEITAAGSTKSGTSMAVPHVSGAYAVLKGETAYPDESIDSTTQRLKSTGKKVLDDRNGLMFPRIDLEAALFELLPDQLPEISGFEPDIAAQGQELIISGTGFRGVDEVLIGDTPAHQFTVKSSRQITVDIGSGSTGDIQVATSLGSDSMPGFTFINSVRETEPNNIMAQANPVNLTGERLAGAMSDQADVDFFRFGFDSGEVSFGIKPVRGLCCSKFIQLTLQNGQGDVLATVQVDESVDEPVLMQVTIDERGAYYLVITETPESEAVFESDYQVTVPENTYANNSPEFTSVPPDVVLMDRTYTYPLQALDPDGDAVYYSILTGPPGLVLDQVSRTITWRPGAEQAGFSDVELLVYDDFGGSGIQNYKIAVIDSALLQVNATDGIFKGHVRVSYDLLDGATVYLVFRCLDANESCGAPIGFTNKGLFNDTRAVPGAVYYYRVRACTVSKCSSLSAADMGFANIAPARPTLIRATDGTFPDRVRVTFNPVEGAVLYRVFRCQDTGQTCGLPIGFPRSTSFDDKKGQPGSIYYYRVKACNSRHCGKFSVVNKGHSSNDADVEMDIPLLRSDKPIPALGDKGRWLLILMLLGIGFVFSYRAYRAGKLDLL